MDARTILEKAIKDSQTAIDLNQTVINKAKLELEKCIAPYAVGDRFLCNINQEKFILAGIGNSEVILVSLLTGESRLAKVKVKASGGITCDEFNAASHYATFTRYFSNRH